MSVPGPVHITYAICGNCHTPIQLCDEGGPHESWRHTLGLAARDGCQDVKAPVGYKCCGKCQDQCIRTPMPTVTDDVWPGTPTDDEHPAVEELPWYYQCE